MTKYNIIDIVYRVTYPIMCLILYHLLYYYSLLLMQFEILFFFCLKQLAFGLCLNISWNKVHKRLSKPNWSILHKARNYAVMIQIVCVLWLSASCVSLCVRVPAVPACACVRVCACVRMLLTRVFLSQWRWHYSHHHYHHYLRWAATHSTPCLPRSLST